MKVRKHKRVNKEKDELWSKIKLLCPDARIHRTELSIYMKIGRDWNKKLIYGETPKKKNSKRTRY